MNQIKNLTPHAITLVQGDTQVTIPPSGTVARVSTFPGSLLESSLPVEVWSPITFGEVVDLPPPEEGVILLVSHLVASAAKRADVYSPALAFAHSRPNDGTVRGEKGEVVGVTRLVRSSQQQQPKENGMNKLENRVFKYSLIQRGISLPLTSSEWENLRRSYESEHPYRVDTSSRTWGSGDYEETTLISNIFIDTIDGVELIATLRCFSKEKIEDRINRQEAGF